MAVREEFWAELQALQRSQINHYPQLSEPIRRRSVEEDQLWAAQVTERLELLVLGVVQSIVAGESPILRVPRASQGTQKTESLVSLCAASSSRRFVQLLYTTGRVYGLLRRNTYATVRDVFYEGVWVYDNQGNVNRSCEDLQRLLGVPRRVLHLTNTAKGLVAGNLRYVTQEGVAVDVSAASNGMLVPECVSGLLELQSDARYVLVVEKDCTFQKILDAHFLRAYGPCILLTGKGYPDLCTRELCCRLWKELQLPVLALTDADPHGLHIAAVYKFGSQNHSESEYRVDGLVWAGVLPTDLAGLQLPQRHLLPLLPSDYGKLAALQAHPLIRASPAWLHQISVMQQLGYKAEIQNLAHVAADFLTAVYLPAKLRHAGWVP